MKDTPPIFFSVIIPTYNRRPFLKKAVDSVLRQTFKHFELIIVDDGSEDQTGQLLRRYQDTRIVYISQDNHGVAHARNRALKAARGQWVAFLDSDDWWLANKLERFYQHIKEFPQIKIFHSEERWFRQGKAHNPRKKHAKPDGFVYHQALPLCCISISTAVVERSVFETVGIFDENFPACEDYDFWLRATYRYPVKLINEYLTEKEGGRADQLSAQWGLDQYRIRALEKMLASGQLSEKDYEKTFCEFQKKCKIFLSGAQKRGRKEESWAYEALMEKYDLIKKVG